MATKGIDKVGQKKGNNKPNGSVMQKSNTTMAAGNIRVTRSSGFMQCRPSEFLPVRFLKHLGGKAAKGLHEVSMRIKPSPKVSSSSSLGRSKPFVTPVDSHRNAAIEDCIEFINSSASLPRSNSVSAIWLALNSVVNGHIWSENIV